MSADQPAKPSYLPDAITVRLRWSKDQEEIGDDLTGTWFVSVDGIAQSPVTDAETLEAALANAAEVMHLHWEPDHER